MSSLEVNFRGTSQPNLGASLSGGCTTDDEVLLAASAGVRARKKTDLLLTTLAALAGLCCALSLLCRRRRLDGPTGRVLRWREAYREGLWAESCRRRLWQTILGSSGAQRARRISAGKGGGGSARSVVYRMTSSRLRSPSGPQAHGAGAGVLDDVTARAHAARDQLRDLARQDTGAAWIGSRILPRPEGEVCLSFGELPGRLHGSLVRPLTTTANVHV